MKMALERLLHPAALSETPPSDDSKLGKGSHIASIGENREAGFLGEVEKLRRENGQPTLRWVRAERRVLVPPIWRMVISLSALIEALENQARRSTRCKRKIARRFPLSFGSLDFLLRE